MARFLILRLEAPLLAFGAEAVDNHGVIRDFPSRSLITGLIANALGYERGEAERHERLQDRLTFATRADRGGERVQDFQTAALAGSDRAWTRSGRPEGRSGGAGTYKGQHLRYRDYLADASLCLAVTLDPADEDPSLDEVAAALDVPARPLFLGRKPCLPAGRILQGEVGAESTLDALLAVPLVATPDAGELSMYWSGAVKDLVPVETIEIASARNWHGDVHVGTERVHRAVVPAAAFPSIAVEGQG